MHSNINNESFLPIEIRKKETTYTFLKATFIFWAFV